MAEKFMKEFWILSDLDTENGPSFSSLTEQFRNAFKMRDAKKMVTTENQITIVFDYPLNREITVTFDAPKNGHGERHGFNKAQFVRAVVSGYRKIYHNHAKCCVWGHHFSDLVLEGALRAASGKYRLLVGS